MRRLKKQNKVNSHIHFKPRQLICLCANVMGESKSSGQTTSGYISGCSYQSFLYGFFLYFFFFILICHTASNYFFIFLLKGY